MHAEAFEVPQAPASEEPDEDGRRKHHQDRRHRARIVPQDGDEVEQPPQRC
jgi:hypothetical protein